MERTIIFKNTENNEELVMPVTPASYQIEHGRKQNTETLCQVGDVTLPGAAVLLDEEPEFLLPAHNYPFNQPKTVLNPYVYLEKLEKWSDAGTVLRYVVSDTPVNAAVRLGPIRYREEGGTNDIKCVVPIRGVRQLAAEEVELAESAVPLAARGVEGDPARAETYTVAAGDTLSGICLRFYKDATLAAALGAYNGIKNINLIHVGQVLKTPEKSALPAAKAAGNGKVGQSNRSVAVTISYRGARAHYGEMIVDYIKESGSTDQVKLTSVHDKKTVYAQRGSRVVIRWLKSDYRVASYIVDGTPQKAWGELSVIADREHQVGVQWANTKN